MPLWFPWDVKSVTLQAACPKAEAACCLQVLVRMLQHRVSDAVLLAMREDLVGYIMAAGVVHRVDELFSLFDRPQVTELLEHRLSLTCSPAAEDGPCQHFAGLKRWPVSSELRQRRAVWT